MDVVRMSSTHPLELERRHRSSSSRHNELGLNASLPCTSATARYANQFSLVTLHVSHSVVVCVRAC
jgi:hypothetical protein